MVNCTAYGWHYDFDDCVDGDNTLRGVASVDAEEMIFAYDSGGLVKESGNSSINFSGKVQYYPAGSNACTSCKAWSSDNLQLTVSDAAVPVHIANGNTRFNYRGPGYQITEALIACRSSRHARRARYLYHR